MPSESVEDYLTELLRLEEGSLPAGTSELARRLGVSRPSVSEMLARLAGLGYLRRRPYGAARLTARGRGAARRVIRRHRLLETFLVEVLDMPADRVHEEAHRLEHAFSEEVIELLDAWMGRPGIDPHGRPIPGGRSSLAPRRRRARLPAEDGEGGTR